MKWKVVIPPSIQWIEDGGLFYTTDIERAREEIPFSILLPNYFSDNVKYVSKPSIRGPLKAFRTSGKVSILIEYLVDFGLDEPSLILITETNHPIEPANTDKMVEIKGKSVVLWDGNFSLGPGFFFFFNDGSTHFVVELYYFSYDEAFKIVESMIKQIE
ncbi:hypothetical protein ACFLRP_00860 [Bacteroidota bacterium]